MAMLRIMSSQQLFNASYGRGNSKYWIWPIYLAVTLSVFSGAHGADAVWPKAAFPSLLPLAGAIGADLFAPDFKIEKMTPSDGSTNVDLNTRVTISFSDKLKEALEPDALLMKDARGNEVAGDVRIDEQKIIFTPAVALSPEVVYTISISEHIRSQSDARLTGQRRAIFSTVKKPIKAASAIGADFLEKRPVPKKTTPIIEDKPAEKSIEPPAPVAKPELPIESPAPVTKPESLIEPLVPIAKPESPTPVVEPQRPVEQAKPDEIKKATQDSVFPFVKRTLPLKNQANVPLGSSIIITFDREMNESSFKSGSILVKDASGKEIEGDIKVKGDRVFFKPKQPLEGKTSYAVLIASSVRAGDGIPLEKDYAWVFITSEAKGRIKDKPKVSDGFDDFAEKVVPVPIVVPAPSVGGIKTKDPANGTVVSEAQKPIAPAASDALSGDSQPSPVLADDTQPATSAKVPVVQEVPLSLLYHYPTNGAKNTDIKSVIGVQFSKAFLSDDARIKLLINGEQEVDGRTSYENNRMIFEPSVPLSYDTSYIASIEGGVTDMDGNTLSETIQWSFTTGSQLNRLAATKQAGLSTSEIFVKQIVLDNNTILSAALVNPILADYENREVTANELQQLRKRLSLEVYKQGYVNSGVIIPDQKIEGGIVRLTMLQGKLSKIELSGQKSVSSDYINQRVTLGASEPLNYFELRRSLLLLEQDPLIKRVNAKLLPGDKLGESYLALEIDEDKPYLMSLSVNNYHVPSVGSERVEYLAMHRNLLGKRDTITGFYAQTRGHKEGYFSYDIPLNVYDTQLGISYSLTDAAIIEKPFKDNNDVTSESSAWQVKLSHPFIKTLSSQLTASAGFDKKSSEITIEALGVNESGERATGPNNVTNLWFSLQGLNRGKKRVLVWQGKLKWGVDALDASIRTDDHADGKYAAVQGNFYFSQYINKVVDKIVVRGMGQIANDTVLSTEKFAAGGVHTVRGYRENQFVRDNGVAGSIELYFPIGDGGGNPTDLTVVSFIDYARLRNKTSVDDPTPITNQIYSIGLGVLWEPKSALQAQAFWGKALKAVSDRDERDENDNLQDLGFHLQLSYRLL